MRTAAFVIAFALSCVSFAQDKPAAPAGPTATPIPDTPPPAAPAPAAKPAAAAKPTPAAPAATASAAKPASPKPLNPERKARREEDARHCLEKGTNTEIIKCAEAYL
jgi:hypothetical protein